jgi:hypothetical protein
MGYVTVTNMVEKRTSFLGSRVPVLPTALALVPATQVKVTSPFSEAIPWRIMLHIGNDTPTAVGLEVSSPLTVGRSDPDSGFRPQLDLTAYGGLDAGISRKHAKLFVFDKSLYIQDCHSTNGTRINDFLIKPDLPYCLKDGDTIEFGRLQMKLSVIRTGF